MEPSHDTYTAEHGANASIRYATCSCGWSGPPRRSVTKLVSDSLDHKARAAVLAELNTPRSV